MMWEILLLLQKVGGGMKILLGSVQNLLSLLPCLPFIRDFALVLIINIVYRICGIYRHTSRLKC